MGISLKDAKIGKKKDEKREKLKLGRHLVRVVDMRQKETRECGFGFFLDFAVVAGPTQVNFEDTFKVFPEMARAKGGKLTKAEVKALDEGKIQIAVAAVGGYIKEAAGVVNQEYFDKATAVEERETDPEARSPFVGALFEVECKGGSNDKGPYVYYEVLPYIADESVFGDVTKGAAPKTTAAPAATKAKAAPAIAKKAAPAFPPAGWAVHPDDADYVFNAETEECIEATELRTRLAA